eukprot:493722-Lingulodinium_polyedra.AAC.1
MGFANSATLAQAVTDRCCAVAGLPEPARVRLGDQPPLAPPAWASILDDVWAVHQGGPGDGDPVAS